MCTLRIYFKRLFLREVLLINLLQFPMNVKSSVNFIAYKLNETSAFSSFQQARSFASIKELQNGSTQYKKLWMRAETRWTLQFVLEEKVTEGKKVAARTMKHKKPLLLAVGRKKCNCYLGECAESDHYLLSSPYFFVCAVLSFAIRRIMKGKVGYSQFFLFLSSSETLSRYSFIASSVPHTLPTSNLWGC